MIRCFAGEPISLACNTIILSLHILGCTNICSPGNISKCNKTALKMQENLCLGPIKQAYKDYMATVPLFYSLTGNPSNDNIHFALRWGSPENPMKSAYLVEQVYENFCKMVWMVIIGVPRFRIWCLILNIGVCLIVILTNFWKFAYPSATTLSD